MHEVSDKIELLLMNVQTIGFIEKIFIELANLRSIPCSTKLVICQEQACLCLNYGIYGMPKNDRESFLKYLKQYLNSNIYYYDANTNDHCFVCNKDALENIAFPIIKDLLIKYGEDRHKIENVAEIPALLKKFQLSLLIILINKVFDVLVSTFYLHLYPDKELKAAKSAWEDILKTIMTDSASIKEAYYSLARFRVAFVNLKEFIKRNQLEQKSSTLFGSISVSLSDIQSAFVPSFWFGLNNKNYILARNVAQSYAKIAAISKSKDWFEYLLPHHLKTHVIYLMSGGASSQFGKDDQLVYIDGNSAFLASEEVIKEEVMSTNLYQHLQTPQWQARGIINMWGLFAAPKTSKEKFEEFVTANKIEKYKKITAETDVRFSKN